FSGERTTRGREPDPRLTIRVRASQRLGIVVERVSAARARVEQEPEKTPIVLRTPADVVEHDRLMKALLQAVMFHDVRWGAKHDGRFLWLLLNSGSCGAYAFNHDPESLRGAHSYRQPRIWFPTPGGTLAGE